MRDAVGRVGARLLTLGASFLGAIVLWEVTSIVLDSPLFPRSLGVIESFVAVLQDGEMYRHLLASAATVAAGYILSVLLALPLAILCYRNLLVASLVLPAHEFIRYIPVPAFVPLVAALLGVGDVTKVSLIFIGTYFQILFLFTADLGEVPEEIEQSARTLGLHGLGLMRRIILPSALPRLLNTARVTFAWAWSYLLVAEVVNAKRGIGYLVLQSYRVLDMQRLAALLVVIGLFGVIVDFLFKIGRRKLCPWEYIDEHRVAA